MSTSAGRLTNYGMGWETTPYSGRYMLVHSGGQQETRTLLYILPSRKMAIAVGVNYEGSNPGVYVDRLFQLLPGHPLSSMLYSPDKLKAAAAEAIKSTFDYGLSSFEQDRKSLAATRRNLTEAFAYFNGLVNPEALKANPQETMTKIRQGAHPVAKQAFTKIGSYMAAETAAEERRRTPRSLCGQGRARIFRRLHHADKSRRYDPKGLHFKEPFAAMVARWPAIGTNPTRNMCVSFG